MTNREICEHLDKAYSHISNAMDELKEINAHATWQDLLRSKRRIAELSRLFGLGDES